ncbi:kielin/chordin-like protein [Homarus americanus]|uniref:kielin/chordin-like protein n=1 Tax=Homarus americanus TaxID=6706 RepID=UPI001C446667|nr:kielin/chordin-like protein [Homarus americanus]
MLPGLEVQVYLKGFRVEETLKNSFFTIPIVIDHMGCFDADGNYHELGHEWGTGDPCLVFFCEKDGITLKRVYCDSASPPRTGCSEYIPEGECCPKWNCSGCVDHTGSYRPLYDVWKTDPCATHLCMETGIQTTHEDCDLGPAPHPSCLRISPSGECCPEWKCSGCLDAHGNYHERGEKWSTIDPCLMLMCTKEGIKAQTIQCEVTRPPPGCPEYTPKGECCPKWNCSVCVDHTGKQHPLYEVWKTDPCTTHVCLQDGIKTSRENCNLGSAPHPSCREIVPLGECCPEWNCRGCKDLEGNYHELGQEWSTEDPCLVFICARDGISARLIHVKRLAHPILAVKNTLKRENVALSGIAVNSPDIYNSWKHCVDPQKCCRHIKDSLAFQQCCHDNGCCTKFCDDPSEGFGGPRFGRFWCLVEPEAVVLRCGLRVPTAPGARSLARGRSSEVIHGDSTSTGSCTLLSAFFSLAKPAAYKQNKNIVGAEKLPSKGFSKPRK